MNLEFIKKNLFLLIILSAFLFVTLPLFHGGFFPTMDDVQVVRIDVMTRELLHGQFPVRMINDFSFGAGYLLFNFYGTLSYYIGALFHLLGLPLVRATKFVFIAGYLIGASGMFFLVRKYTDKLIATICTLLFLTAAYVNYDVYTRGQLGEFFGFIMLPLVFWSFIRLHDTKKFKDVFIAGLIYAAAIISHPLTAVMGSIFLLLLVILPPYRKDYFKKYFAALIFGLGLAAFSWIPVAVEQRYLSLSNNTYETQQYLTNFFSPLQLAGIQKISQGIKPPLLGIGLFVGALLGIASLLKKSKYTSVGFFAAVSFVISLFMTSVWSKTIWDSISYARLAQFPWRYLVITTISAIMLVGFALNQLKKTWIKILIGILLLLPAVTIQYSYLRPTSYNYISVYTADDVCNTSTWAQEYMPKWVKQCITKKTHLPLVQGQNKSLMLSKIRQLPSGQVMFNTKGQGIVVVRKYYFPGWIARIDGKATVTYPSTKYGLVTFEIPQGMHNIQVAFENTWDRTLGNVISVLSVLLGIVILLWPIIKKKIL